METGCEILFCERKRGFTAAEPVRNRASQRSVTDQERAHRALSLPDK